MEGAEELASFTAGLPITTQEWLTTQFYLWEKRGRGWQLWPYSVELEPPFEPFMFHSIPTGPGVDDARKPTLLSSLLERIRTHFVSSPQLASHRFHTKPRLRETPPNMWVREPSERSRSRCRLQ